MTADQALLYAGAAAAGVVSGGQLFVAVTIIPVKRRWPEPFAQRVHAELLADPADHFLRPMLGVAFGFALIAMIVHHALDLEGIANLVALLGCAGVMVTSLRVQFPINKAVVALPPDGPEGQYLGMAGRWDTGHRVRTAF